MKKLVTVVKEEQKMLVDKYVIRAIREDYCKKTVIGEKVFPTGVYPRDEEIASFLYETKATFCVIEKIYVLEEPVLPFS